MFVRLGWMCVLCVLFGVCYSERDAADHPPNTHTKQPKPTKKPKSPVVILSHHLCTALYMLIPYHYPRYHWCMAYCMLVEVNTWLLIARRRRAPSSPSTCEHTKK